MNAVPTWSRLVSAAGAELPLTAAHLDAVAAAGVATVRLTQRFRNPTDAVAEVTYLLPLPPDAAVGGFTFTVAGERLVGVLRRRDDARADYQRALLDGRAASLLEQTRDGLFTQRLGNLPPGAEVEIEVELDQALTWRGDGWVWRFPTVVAPRYVDALIPDPEAIAVDVLDGPVAGRLSLALRIDDEVTGEVTSPSHPTSQASTSLRLDGARLDRDVVVRWPVAHREPGVTLTVASHADGLVGRIVVTPPARAADAVPRDLVLLLDVSGSMSGAPMRQLRDVSAALVDDLGDGDTVEIVAFGGDVRRFRHGASAADPATRAAARAWIKALTASGGTPMDEGIVAALAARRGDAQRQVVLITDGHIGFEDRVIDLIRRHLPAGSRLHAVGVGQSVHRGLLSRAARLGGGRELILDPDDRPTAALDELRAALRAPVLVDLTLAGDALVSPATPRGIDVFEGAPAVAHALLRPGVLEVTGRGPDGPWRHTLQVDAPFGPTDTAIGRAFARDAVAWRELDPWSAARDADVEALGLRWGVATSRTSWVATSDAAVVDPNAPVRALRAPHEAPAGLLAEAEAAGGPIPRAAMAQRPMPPAPMSAPPPGAGSPKRRRAEVPPSPLARAAAAVRRALGAKEEGGGDPPRAGLRLVSADVLDGVLILTFEATTAGVWTPPATVSLDGALVAVDARRTTHADPLQPADRVRVVIRGVGRPAQVTLDGHAYPVPAPR